MACWNFWRRSAEPTGDLAALHTSAPVTQAAPYALQKKEICWFQPIWFVRHFESPYLRARGEV